MYSAPERFCSIKFDTDHPADAYAQSNRSKVTNKVKVCEHTVLPDMKVSLRNEHQKGSNCDNPLGTDKFPAALGKEVKIPSQMLPWYKW